MERNWYAIYTNPRSEKRAAEQLREKNIETYLPLVKTLRQWSDRRKMVEEPLFKSYLFVHITKDEYYDVLNTQGVARYITFEGKAVPIPPKQIEAIRYFLDNEPIPEAIQSGLAKGQRVEIIRGSLTGLQGILSSEKGKHKVIIEIEALGQAISLTVSKSILKVVNSET